MVKRGPMLGEGKRLARSKPAQKKRKPVEKVLATAANMADENEIAAYLERNLDEVDKPQKLIEPLANAIFESDQSAEECAERLAAHAAARRDEPQILDAIALQLENWHCDDDAFEVARLAVAAGSRNKRVLELLGRMLVGRGDAAGVPLLERAIERDPEWTQPRVTLALWLAGRDPARALALVDRDDSKAHEVRSMLHEAAGRARDANLALREALEEFDHDAEGHNELAMWHFHENRYARALVHAKALFEWRTTTSARRQSELDLNEVDETIVKCYRLGGAFEAVIPWLVERCKPGEDIPADMAWHAWYALTSFHPTRELDLAIRCAHAVSRRDESLHDLHEVRAWRVRIASEREQAGEQGLLEELAKTGLDDDSTAWVELADAYYAQDHFDAAHAAVDRALQLDPKSVGALSTLFNLALAAGDTAALHKTAEAILAAEPASHQGPEHMGRSFARRGDVEPAIANAKRGVSIAPYCHNAWLGLAEACIVAGDLARAREAATRSLALEAAQLGDDVSIVQAALFADAAALDRTLHERFKHLPAAPFPSFVEKLRAAVQSRTTST